MILNKIRNKFWGSTNFKLHMQEMEDDLKDMWIEFSLKMLKELQKVRQLKGFERDEFGRWYKLYPTCRVPVTDELLLDSLNTRQENIDSVDNFWLTFCKEGAKMIGIKDCDDCEEKFNEIN